MLVTEIRPQKRDETRYNIFIPLLLSIIATLFSNTYRSSIEQTAQ